MSARTPILRTSERRAFKRCIWRWWQSYRMGLVPLGSTSDALWFGTGVHLALAEWYKGPGLKRGPYPSETFSKWAENELRFIKTREQYRGQAGEAFIEEKLVPAKELGVVMLDGYLNTYGKDPQWSIIAPEHSGQIDIMDPNDVDKLLCTYAFTYDLVYRCLECGRVKLGEHKTAAAISLGHLPLDDQAGSYWAIASQELSASGLIGPKERIAGIQYNFLRKAKPDPRPRNSEGHYLNKATKQDAVDALTEAGVLFDVKASGEKLMELAAEKLVKVEGKVSKSQPQPLFVREFVTRTAKQRAQQIRRIQGEALHMAYVREGYLPLTKNPTFNCQWDCDFHELCLLDETGGDVTEYRESMFRQQDPYADHRKSTEE